MNKKHKFPNVIDVTCIVLLLLLAAGAYWLTHHNAGETKLSRTYVIELNNLEPDMEELVTVGAKVEDNIKNYHIGVVEGIELTDYMIQATDRVNNVVKDVPLENKVRLLVTIRVDTVETESSITTETGYVIKTGNAVSVTIGDLSASGYVLEVQR